MWFAGCGFVLSLYVPFIMANSINCLFLSSSSPSACSKEGETTNKEHHYSFAKYSDMILKRICYTAKLLFHQSPTRHSDYTVTITVTMQSLFSSPRHRTIEQWLHRTLVIRYPLPWGLCRSLSTRHLVGNCTVTTWEDTRYLVHTVTV